MDASLESRRSAMEMAIWVMDRKQPLDVVLQELDRSGLEGSDRAFARTMLMHVLRQSRRIDAVIAGFLNKPFEAKHHEIIHILRLGVVQLLWLKTPPHAAVHSSVELTKLIGHRNMAGLVNAVLQNIIRAQLTPKSVRGEMRDYVPRWLYESWSDAYDQRTADAMIAAQLEEPPLDIYVPDNVDEWAEKLEGYVVHGHTVRRDNARVELLPGYEDGAWWVQDVAASLPVEMLGHLTGKTVMDVCAAPGGKTAQLAAVGAHVVALDRSSKRLERLRANMKRLKLPVEVVVADVMEWQPKKLVDAVLLDAPCSATGTIRRHPDLIYHKNLADISAMAKIQSAMLPKAAEWLKDGGVLVYCVCSLQPEEGELQIAKFLDTHPHFRLESIDSLFPNEWIKQGMLRCLPSFLAGEGGMDGFFAARLRKG